MAKQFSTIALVLGLALVAASFVWKQSHGAWSPEQAANYSEAAAELHRLTYEAAQAQDLLSKSHSSAEAQKSLADKRLAKVADAPGPVDPKTATPERTIAAYADAKKRYDEARAALDQARSHGEGTASVLRWIGVALAVVGLTGLAIFRSHEA
jgi:hypothetical protein